MPLPGDHDLYPYYSGLVSDYTQAWMNSMLSGFTFQNCADSIGIQDWITARDQMISAASYMMQAFWYIIGISYVGTASPLTEFLYNEYDYWGGKVTLPDMTDAVLSGEFTEIRDWLGSQWACQQVMWDQPFFVQPYLDMVNRVRT